MEVARIGQINRSADITLYPNLGHAPFFEDPATFNSDLVAFVRRCESAGQGGSDISKAGAVWG
jgi:hypothetical protein